MPHWNFRASGVSGSQGGQPAVRTALLGFAAVLSRGGAVSVVAALSGRRGPGHPVRVRVTRIRGGREARDVCGIGRNDHAPLR